MNEKMKNRKLKLAAVGLGWVTTNRHLSILDKLDVFDVIGVIDHHPSRAKEVAKKRNYKYFGHSENLEDISWLNEVDVVSIGTNPHSHYHLIKSALSLNKHVLTEKPFTMKVEEGEELVSLARSKNLILGIMHNFQFSTATKMLIKDLERGYFGKIKAIAAVQLSNPKRRLPKWYNDLPFGLFYDESPHFFYLLRRLSPGKLQFLKSDVFPSTFGHTTPAFIEVKYSCDSKDYGVIPVTMSMNFEAPLSEWHILVYGEHYLGDIDIFREIYVRLPNDGLHVTSTVVRTSLLVTFQHWAQHFTSGVKHLQGKLWGGSEEVFNRFAEAVFQNTEPEYVGPKDALAVLKMQHEVIQKHSLLLKPDLVPVS